MPRRLRVALRGFSVPTHGVTVCVDTTGKAMPTQSGLTEFERQRLLKELAEIEAEMAEMREQATKITARLKDPSSARRSRPA